MRPLQHHPTEPGQLAAGVAAGFTAVVAGLTATGRATIAALAMNRYRPNDPRLEETIP